MKKEQLSDAIGQLDDGLITAADRTRAPRKRGRLWLRLWAAAACLCLIVGCALAFAGGGLPFGSTEGETPTVTEQGTVSARMGEVTALATPTYPETAAYPNPEDYYDSFGTFDDEGYDAAMEAWKRTNTVTAPSGTGRAALTAFTGSLMEQLLAGEEAENRVCSPLNIYLALAMLAETTEGSSRAQLLEALRAESLAGLRADAAALWQSNYKKDGRVTSLLGSSLWLRDGTEYNAATLDNLKRIYYASAYSGVMGSETYNEALRSWVNEQTGGLLEEAAQGLSLDERTVLALVTTIYFKAAWENRFSEALTREEIFHAETGDVICEFLHSANLSTIYHGSGWDATPLSLNGGGAMWLVLPQEGTAVERLLSDQSILNLTAESENWEETSFCTVNLSLPKFDVSSNLDLIESMTALGITEVFDSQAADFSALLEQSKGLSLSEATHAARVSVDEEGCTGAAYTELQITESAMESGEAPLDFTVDRPFLFLITGEDGTVLFAGVVHQPEA